MKQQAQQTPGVSIYLQRWFHPALHTLALGTQQLLVGKPAALCCVKRSAVFEL